MSSVQTCVCRWCARAYVPDVRNADRQGFCTRRGCGRERKRARQRFWYRQRYGTDASFRERAKKRVGEHRHRLAQARAQAPPAAGAAEARLEHVEQALLGLAAQMVGEPEGMPVDELVRSWAERGRRRVAVMARGP
jgi:hypothetical protein